MPEYRIYYINDANHVVRIDLTEAADDEAAVRAAQLRVDGKVIEVWDKGRPIARLEGGTREPIGAGPGV